MVREMAMHSVLHTMDETSMQLVLDSACKNMLSEERRANLQVAVQQHLGKPMRLTIAIGESQEATPAAHLQRQQQQRLANAQAAISNDSNVQKIVETFGAQIKTDTIQPVD